MKACSGKVITLFQWLREGERVTSIIIVLYAHRATEMSPNNSINGSSRPNDKKVLLALEISVPCLLEPLRLERS